METLKLNKEHFDKNNKYIGDVNLDKFDGSIEIKASLGIVLFKSINVTGYIHAKAGTGIEAVRGISCMGNLSANLRIFTGLTNHRIPSEEEKTVTCLKLNNGEVCYGNLIETSKND